MTLLNLLVPGLGLLRVGRPRLAGVVYGAALAVVVAYVGVLALVRDLTFGNYAALVTLGVAATLVIYVTALVLTWRHSRTRVDPTPAWSRWYAVVGAALVAFAVSWMLTGLSVRDYRTFYVPSEAMEPTLMVNDRFLVAMGQPANLARGDVILVNAGDGAIYVKRLAALPGDRIALHGGEVWINGAAVRQQPAGVRQVRFGVSGPFEARLFRETLPGEVGSHLIQDMGPSAEDDMLEVRVPPGRLFVLGDNRDDSADSRVPKFAGGLELVPLQDVVGRAMFITWPRNKMGRRLRGDE